MSANTTIASPTRARALAVAVDIRAVEQRAHRALPAALVSHGVHRGTVPRHMLPVGMSVSPIIAPIGSRLRLRPLGRSGSLSKLSICLGSIGLQREMALASSWMRAGVSSFAHSARSVAIASRSWRISLRSLARRSACSVDSNLIS